MRSVVFSFLLAALGAAGFGAGTTAATAADATVQSFRYRPVNVTGIAATTDRIIVKLRPGWAVPWERMPSAHVATLSAHAQTALSAMRAIDDRTHVLKLAQPADVAEVRAIADRIATHESVEYAEPDRRHFPAAVPNDQYYSGTQWYLYDATVGLNLPQAWDLSKGNTNVTIAVLDTGILPHTDLPVPVGGNWAYPLGYDFVGQDLNASGAAVANSFLTANDGDGWDANPADPGNWITALDNAAFLAIDPNTPCLPAGTTHTDSDWHGTSVAGIIGAKTNNAVGANSGGIAGVVWNANLLPVRVLGKCGGYDSDIAVGIRWAAGLSVANAPANQSPAKIINLSLGGPGACSATTQAAIDGALGVNGSAVAIVTAAGNDGGQAANDSPGNCVGVINVAAVTQAGNLASYSNSGTGVTISAPGGAGSGAPCVYNAANDWIFSTSDSGTTAPLNDSTYTCFAGTSASAPLVSGVIGLMVAANQTLTATQVTNILKATARAFPASSTCNTSRCGAGLVNAYAAVNAAINNPNITPSGSTAPPVSGGSGGGGGGGCTLSAGDGGGLDPTLPALMLLAAFGTLARRRAVARIQ